MRSIRVQIGDSEVLRDITLNVDSGSSLAILGESGSGKTTLLRTIVGLAYPSRGEVLIGGVDVTDVPTAERGVALVTQESSLEPNSTLVTNVERPLTFRGERTQIERRRRALVELRRFGMGWRAFTRAAESSAGERHLAATARGTVRKPAMLLLDEPLTALDPDRSQQMIRQIRAQYGKVGTTLIVATNSWDVAAGLTDRVAVLDDGVISQVGPPADLYDSPASVHVAELTGKWRFNRLAGQAQSVPGEQTRIETPAGPIRTWRQLPSQPLLVGIRPGDLSLSNDGELRGFVENSSVLGPYSLVEVDAAGLPLQAIGPVPAPTPGSEVRMSWRRAHLFNLEGKALTHID